MSDSHKEKLYDLSVFIFRRDLRIADNTGLLRAMADSDAVLPVFICTPTQLSNDNKYKSSNAVQFMIESLYDLDEQIHKAHNRSNLIVTYGDEVAIIKKLYQKLKFDALYVNEDYTPYSQTRDASIKKYCKSVGADFVSVTDLLLLDRNDLTAKNGNYYKVFTQFYKSALSYPIRSVSHSHPKNFASNPPDFPTWRIGKIDKYLQSKDLYEINDQIALKGGRKHGLKILAKLGSMHKYGKTRDDMSVPTTMLSPHNKFGTVSIREVYEGFKNTAKSVDLTKQLYWRDFYYYVGIHFKADFYGHNHLVRHNKKKGKWENRKSFYKAWTEARTGFPIVDAAMTELNTTGYMHNRGRLIVASFLVKDLLIDWKYGERYFSQKLIDIDRAQNTGNWNWSSSFGLDATSFLRIFNPWTQSATYDSTAAYIKRWLPQLKDVDVKDLHQWNTKHDSYPDIDYPKPIVSHEDRRKKFLHYYKANFG